MTEMVPEHPPATVKWQPLDPEQRRVLGVLIEKAKTTPAGYPMSESAIVTACNQKSNRDPVMNLDDFTVGRVLTEMVTMGAVSEVDWVGRVSGNQVGHDEPRQGKSWISGAMICA